MLTLRVARLQHGEHVYFRRFLAWLNTIGNGRLVIRFALTGGLFSVTPLH